MNDTIYRASDKLCPYCMDEGPFVQKGKATVVRTGDERTYLECLRCGNTFIKHAKSKYTPAYLTVEIVKAEQSQEEIRK